MTRTECAKKCTFHIPYIFAPNLCSESTQLAGIQTRASKTVIYAPGVELSRFYDRHAITALVVSVSTTSQVERQ